MKRKMLVAALMVVAAFYNVNAASRTELWAQVDAAVAKGLPRTAITNLDRIIPAALEDKAYGEAAKAIARKIVLAGNIQGNKPEEKIALMDAEIEKAPKEILPLLQTLRAHWYWHYFQQNRWRFMRRTATAEAPGKDFTTWDLPRLFAEIDKHFQTALSHGDVLKQTPVAVFNDVINQGTVPDSYRPTLFDFLAHEALKFYTSGEQGAAKPEDAFEVAADSPIFGASDSFMNWKPETTQTDSAMLKAIQLCQELLRFHEKDKDPTPFVDADLDRLHYGYSIATGETKKARYKAALQGFADKWMDHEVSALALYYWATLVQEEKDLVAARKIAQRGENAHRNSFGGKMCHNLIQQIEGKSASISTERVWNKPLPKITVRYRNVTEVHFRIVPWNWNEFLNKRSSRPEWLNDPERKELLTREFVREWSEKLPPTTDYKEKAQEFPAPENLKPGHYFIVASHRADFSDADNQVTYANFWVSDLALVVATRQGKVEGFVLEALSGDPIVEAEVTGWYFENQGNRLQVGPVKTDTNGWFSFKPPQYRGLLLRAVAKGQELASAQEYSAWTPGVPTTTEQAVFFTDRALYRPGQTISYKGIFVRVDPNKDDYDVIKNRGLEVIFADPNGKEVAKVNHLTTDFGSFSGSFTAPRDRVMGAYQIYTRAGQGGATHFNVEEYKRPKFQATLEVPKVAPKLNDLVALQGKAEAYTGAAVDGAKVKWRVVREVRWPDWWYWWGWWRGGRPFTGSESQEIAHGSAQTGTDGTFKLEFVAKPDPQVDEKSEATFHFRIYADVTDTTGETRSADRSVNVGFVALRALVQCDEWQTDEKAVELKLATTTLDGEGQKAEGSLKICRLKEPPAVVRPRLDGPRWRGDADGDGKPDPDLSNPKDWPEGDVVLEKGWTTDAEGKATLQARLTVGVYRATLETQDRFGKKVTGRQQIMVLQPGANKLGIKVPNLVAAPKWAAEPGDEFMALWGTGYGSGRAFIEVEHRGQMIQRYWTKAEATQAQVKQAVQEGMRGGFTVHVTQVRENRAYLASHRVDVPWSNKDLEVKWEHFTSKLQPSQKETWSLAITPKTKSKTEVEKAVAEMAATLYDESLDAYKMHHWLQKFGFFRVDSSYRYTDFANNLRQLQHFKGNWKTDFWPADWRYREFPSDLVANFWGYGWSGGRGFGGGGGMLGREAQNRMQMDGVPLAPPMAMAAAAPGAEMAKGAALGEGEQLRKRAEDKSEGGGPGAAPPAPDLSKVSARKNLNESAFFYPQLTADSNGLIRMTFTMPEALTTWKFMAFAHDQKLRSGYLEAKTITAKDLMVQPNPPRFLREGDVLEFTVKVSNQSAARQEGKVRLTFNDAQSDQSADKLLGNSTPEQDFDIPSKESRSFSWRITVPDGCGFLTYKAVGATTKISDGEEGYLPVLSRRVFVTESLPLPIRVKAGAKEITKTFEFTKLLKSGGSDTLRNAGLTVQMVSNPSWYAVMALPYLMEYPHESTDATFNRYYANALARNIANSDPKIHRVFEQWRGTPALDSPLEKNQDLKSVMLEETPWLRQAQKEGQARKNVGLLFDDNRLNSELAAALNKLEQAQLPDGLWPWFPGCPTGNPYMSLYITTGFGRLRHLGVTVDVKCAVKSLAGLDQWMEQHYRWILEHVKDKEEYVPSGTDAFYLYGRSFFMKDRPVAKNHEEMLNFFLGQARKHWLKTGVRLTQGHLAIALRRWGSDANAAVAQEIMRSLRERSVTNEEMGMFWRDLELSWWWYHAPIETQALMIEAFDEVAGDKDTVEECRVWLLKQKQTQDWKTTRATADAIYALLLRGKDILANDKLVEISLGGVPVRPELPREGLTPAVEAGTGFFEKKFAVADIKPGLGEITVKKLGEGVSWGSVHWQYLEDMTKVTSYEGTPLKLKKSLYTKTTTKKGQVLEPVKGALQVGDELVVRLELRVDRDMEYVHLKDQRGSGTEPVNVISRYKYQDGLGYYETTRDTASHFFMDYLPKGTYVFEYSVRIQHRGQYQTGLANIQCLYAPEFNSHSESFSLIVK